MPQPQKQSIQLLCSLYGHGGRPCLFSHACPTMGMKATSELSRLLVPLFPPWPHDPSVPPCCLRLGSMLGQLYPGSWPCRLCLGSMLCRLCCGPWLCRFRLCSMLGQFHPGSWPCHLCLGSMLSQLHPGSWPCHLHLGSMLSRLHPGHWSCRLLLGFIRHHLSPVFWPCHLLGSMLHYDLILCFTIQAHLCTMIHARYYHQAMTQAHFHFMGLTLVLLWSTPSWSSLLFWIWCFVWQPGAFYWKGYMLWLFRHFLLSA